MSEHRYSSNNFKVPPLSIAKISEFANRIRRSVQPKGVYFDVALFMEFGLPKIEPDFELIILSEQQMGANHGITNPAEKSIILREDVYEGALEGKGRDRLTVAHELGHYFMHKSVGFARCAPNAILKPFEDSEWQANCFGGELLIPINNPIIQKSSVSEIMQRCGVSQQAAEIAYNRIRKNR